MDRAVVLEGARDIEGVGERFVGVEHPRLEFLLGIHDVVGDIVAVGPRRRRPDRDGGRCPARSCPPHEHCSEMTGDGDQCRRREQRDTIQPFRRVYFLVVLYSPESACSLSITELLNPRIASPIPFPSSGNLFGPNTSKAMPKITSRCIGCSSPSPIGFILQFTLIVQTSS